MYEHIVNRENVEVLTAFVNAFENLKLLCESLLRIFSESSGENTAKIMPTARAEKT